MKLINLLVAGIASVDAQWNPLNQPCMQSCWILMQPDTTLCRENNVTSLSRMVSCAQAQCPATATTASTLQIPDPDALLAKIHISLSPKEQYSCQDSFMPAIGNQADQDTTTLTLSGTGLCVTSPYQFKSFVPHAFGIAELQGMCHIAIFDEKNCAGSSGPPVEIGGMPAADGQCIFHQGRSARLSCDMDHVVQMLQKTVGSDLGAQAQAYFNNQCQSMDSAQASPASAGQPGYNGTTAAPLYATGYNTAASASTSAKSATSLASVVALNPSTTGSQLPTTNMAHEERRASSSIMALATVLLVAAMVL